MSLHPVTWTEGKLSLPPLVVHHASFYLEASSGLGFQYVVASDIRSVRTMNAGMNTVGLHIEAVAFSFEWTISHPLHIRNGLSGDRNT